MTVVEEVAPTNALAARGFDLSQRGKCKVCGTAIAGNRFYCDEHRPAKKAPSTSRKRGGMTPTQVRESPTPVADALRDIGNSPSPKRPTTAATTKVVGKLIYYLFLAIVMGVVGADTTLNEEQQEATAGALALSNEDAEAIARPIARFLTPTAFWQKAGSSVVENSDLIDAAVATYNAASGILRFQRERKRRAARFAGQLSMNGHAPAPAPPPGPEMTIPVREGAALIVPESWGGTVDAKTIAEIRRLHKQPESG